MKHINASCIIMLILAAGSLRGQEVYPTAILNFEERGRAVAGYAGKVADILYAELAGHPEIWLVERSAINQVLQEAELNLSGAVAPGQAAQVGQLVGAKILITGSVIETDNTIYLIAKMIGTETSLVLAESVKGGMSDELGPLVETLAGRVAEAIATKGKTIVATRVPEVDRVANLKALLGEGERPTLMVSIKEQHVGQSTIDPAAQTEFVLLSKQVGFEVIAAGAGSEKQADVVITGEGISEFAMRRGNLVSVKARVELQAVNRRDNTVIAIDRQTAVVVDLTEHIAGKAALQEAAARIAERLLPVIAGR
ncbi:MAG TPA: CsgG/HfaB family protein [Kiritimatiellia bacterium]|nr:CsgG/HfaB family protein [Kiritimatiellia bacterium]HMP33123.1 CsgG/HfaB family protein [Kiritimatiellia bacterium]